MLNLVKEPGHAILQRLAEEKHRLEEEEHGQEKQGQPQPGVEHQPVQLVRQIVREPGGHLDRVRHDTGHVRLNGVVRVQGFPHLFRGHGLLLRPQGLGHDGQGFPLGVPVFGTEQHHGNAQGLGHGGGVDVNAELAGFVRHIQEQDGGQPQGF